MQATVYLFDDLAWRKRARWSRPTDPHDLDQFVCQLETLLKRLGDLHLRISLARLPVGEPGEGTPLGQAIVQNLQDPCALVGLMPDGSVVAAFLGPRANDSAVADDEMAARISRRFERALRLAKTDPAGLLGGLTVAHCWSDEIFDVPSLVLELASVRRSVTDIASIDRSSSRRPA